MLATMPMKFQDVTGDAMSTPYPAKFKQADLARREIQLIHVARSQTGMDDDTYRAMLHDRFGVASSKDMDWRQRKQLLDYFKTLGFKVRSTGKYTGAVKANPSRALAADPESRKIRSLWILLHELGAVRNPSEEALAVYVKRLTKVDALQWINGEQAQTLIETLKKWAMRFLPAKVEAMARQCSDAIQSSVLKLPEDRVNELSGVIGAAQRYGTFDPMQDAYQVLMKALAEVKNG